MKKLLIAIVALVIIAAVAVGVRTLGARNETDVVDARDAADLVGDGPRDPADIKAGDRPEPGAYRYAGSGREQVSALGGSKHVFPSEFSSIVRLDPKDDCRWTSDIVYVKQHIEERRYCTQHGTVVDRGFRRKIEFFNQLQTTEYTCGADAERLRTKAHEGDVWKWTCTQGVKTTSDYTLKYLGTQSLTIGGETVKTFHTKVTSRQHGETNGSDSSEFWLASTGLIVKFSADLDVTTSSVLGKTRFQEQLAYTLVSMVPAET